MTLRDNILFGKPYVKNGYERILNECCLMDDLSILAGGDKTEIGERVCMTTVKAEWNERYYVDVFQTISMYDFVVRSK